MIRSRTPITGAVPRRDHLMSLQASSLSPRNVLFLDAATCAVMGIGLTLLPGLVHSITRIPAPLLFYAGLSLLPIAAFMALVAMAGAPTIGVWLVILGNAGWVIASLALIFGDWIAPNMLGIAFIGVQAIAVAILAALEYSGLNAARQIAA
jgi:hypothetical protein